MISSHRWRKSVFEAAYNWQPGACAGSRETLARRVQTGNWSYRIGMNIARVYCRAGRNDEARVYPLRVLEFSPDLHSHDLTKTIGSKTRPFPHQAGELRFLRPRSKARAVGMTSISLRSKDSQPRPGSLFQVRYLSTARSESACAGAPASHCWRRASKNSSTRPKISGALFDS